jgi:hypothetical protein
VSGLLYRLDGGGWLGHLGALLERALLELFFLVDHTLLRVVFLFCQL